MTVFKTILQKQALNPRQSDFRIICSHFPFGFHITRNHPLHKITREHSFSNFPIWKPMKPTNAIQRWISISLNCFFSNTNHSLSFVKQISRIHFSKEFHKSPFNKTFHVSKFWVQLFYTILQVGTREVYYIDSAQCSVASHYESSFGVSATKLWNLLPAKVNSQTALEPFKVALGIFLKSFPDTPPTDGYTSATNNSLLEWNLQKNRHQEYMEDVRDTVVQKWSLPNLPKVPKVSIYCF